MNGPRERSHMGLIYVVMWPRHGWCGWRFNHDRFGTEWDVTVSSRGLSRPTLVLSLVYDIYGFTILKLIRITF